MRIRILFAAAALCLPARLLSQSPPSPSTRTEIADAARRLITKARFSSFVTVGEKGEPRARIVDPFAPDSSFVVWVATNAHTRKVQEIKGNPNVVLLWFDPGDPGYVQLSGRATLVSDSASKSQHWKEDWRGMYRDRNRGDDYLLIRIVPTHLEIVSHTEKMVSDPRTWKPVSIDF